MFVPKKLKWQDFGTTSTAKFWFLSFVCLKEANGTYTARMQHGKNCPPLAEKRKFSTLQEAKSCVEHYLLHHQILAHFDLQKIRLKPLKWESSRDRLEESTLRANIFGISISIMPNEHGKIKAVVYVPNERPLIFDCFLNKKEAKEYIEQEYLPNYLKNFYQ